MAHAPACNDGGDHTAVRHRTATVDGLSIYYREAGDPRNPTLVLLHGFPSSSVMFRDLIPRLADELHLIAPDYPGFGAATHPRPAGSATRSIASPESSIDSSTSRASRSTAFTCRTTAARSGSA